MTAEYGLLMGIFGTTFTIVGFLVAYIVYERHRKNIERTEADKKKKISYGIE